MKKICLSIFVFLTQLISFGQSSEVEPNNSFGTVDELLINDPTDASLGGGDTVDYHGLHFNYNANFYLVLTATNTAASGPPSQLNLAFYNTLLFNGQYVSTIFYGGIILNAGATYSDTIIVCGQAVDSFYLKFETTGEFDYTMEWFPVNAFAEDDLFYNYNNTFATASPFTYNVQNEASLKYEFWGGSNWDTVDYFRSILPAANYDSVQLNIRAQSNSCYGNKWIKYFCYKNGNTVPFATGFVGNDSTVTTYQEVNTHILLNNMAQGDTLFVKFIADGPFGYSFIYKYIDPYDDDEDNCCIYNAIPMEEGIAVSGNVGEYNTGTSQFIDQFDTYRIVLPHDGAVKLWITAKNNECDQEFYYLSADILDQFGNELANIDLMNWSPFPTCNELKTDSLKIRSFSAGTFYLRFRTDNNYDVHPGKISYNIRYELVDSTGNVDPEPNGTTATAIPMTAGQVKKGHVRFMKDATSYDIRDYYKTVFPADGSLRVYLKSTYRAEDGGTTLNFYTSGFSGASTPNPPLNYFQADSVYLDTFNICGTAGGDLYFELTSSVPYEYEFWYEIIDTSTIDNDIEPNNSFAQSRLTGAAVTKKGHIKYVNSAGTDDYDYYKFVYHTTDSLKIYLQATNTSCVSNRTVTFRLYNKAQSNTVTKTKTNVGAGQTVTDSIKVKVTITSNPDSMYLRVDANEAFKYQFTTNLRLPSSTFSISGDTAVCISTQIYKAINVADEPVTYNWSLPLGGGTLSFVDSIATVVWNTNGNRSIQLYLSNALGNSQTKLRNVVVNGSAPSQVPVALNFARTLSTGSLPPGATCQWYKNDTLISGATATSYYAADSGSFTVKFVNDCGPGPVSNAISFAAAAQPQTITFPHIPTISMSPTARDTLQATASSALPVFFQKISGPGTILNDTLFVTGVGTIIVKARQPGDDIYSAAPDNYDTITVIKGNQIITFDSIPNQIFDANKITLIASSSMGQSISYSIIAGSTYASVSSNKITKKGAGTVTVRASQTGNANYNAATPVERTFCIGVRTLTPITGDANPCLNTYRYNTQKIPGAIFVWTLSGGGILTTNNDTAWVQWQTPGSYTLTVKANSPCDTVYTNLQSYTISTSSNLPGVVSNMLPANNAIDQQLPLTLSWIPGINTVNYDLYLWDSAAAVPVTPYAANINDIQYIIPKNPGLPYNRPYKWKVVAKNPCTQTTGPVQQFRLIPLPDLMVSDVQAPATATSGQTITISWKVTNIGPGRTKTSDTWYDGVYFALDTVPFVSFAGSPSWNASSWNSLTANGRPLLLGKKIRPSSLDSGQFYTNSLDFTLPLSYSFPVYVYVIAANNHPNYPLFQASVLNDTARKQNPIIISLAPTPDFRVDSVFAPASTFSGSTVNLTYKVKNYGVVTPAYSSWTDSVFMSQSPLFDRSNAFPISLPKTNGSYYPNAKEATVFNDSVQVLPDSFYTRNLQVVIPNYIFGTWFIYVKANAKETAPFVYEGALNNNNINRAQVQVYLTPTPKLTVNTLSVPVTAASTTQPMGVNWNIKNDGFTDNIEKNKGHYFVIPAGSCPCSGYNCVGPPKYLDSLSQGSSYWLDRVYLSTDSSALNVNSAVLLSELKHGIQQFAGALYPDNMTTCGSITPVNVAHALYPGSNFPKVLNFNVPSDLQPGNYYVYVYTNPTKTVFEYPGIAQIKRSTLPITVQRPDAVVSSIAVPSNTIGGTTVAIDYSVLNNGPGAVFNHLRKDRLYISNFSSFEGSAQLIGTNTFTEDLPVGSAVPHTFMYTIPPATTGNKYFYVLTNYDSSFRETNSVNNLSAAALTTVSAAIPADLVVSNIQMPDTTFTIFTRFLTYTVTNNGTGTTAGTWTDSVYFSCSPTFNFATNYYVAKKIQSRAVPPGGNYTDTIHITIPNMSYEFNACFPQTANQAAYFFIKTNAGLSIYEGSNTNNNVTGTGSKILTNPLVDQIVTTVSAPDTATVGFVYPVSWLVKNIGYNPTNYYYYLWVDAIYFSADSIADATDVIAGDYLKYLRINRGEDNADSKSPYTPVLLTGDYYVYVKTNSRNSIRGEKVLSNNVNFIRNGSGAAKKIHVIRPLLADLTDSILSAPVSVAAGQPITVIYKVINNGTGVTYPGTSLQNEVRLSEDFLANPNDGDRLLATRTRIGTLSPGQFYYDTVTATIPSATIPGNYVLISKANSNNVVVESNINNNLGFSLLSVYTPPVTDLIVSNVYKPDTVYLGYTIDTAKWVITNTSGEQARGYSSDGIYLSAGNLFDSTAVLIGIKNKNINIQPLQSDTVKMAPLVTGVVEGNYNVFVKTDLLYNILESDKDNNTGMSPTPIYVKVRELPMNVPELNTLHNISRYYKMRIPDSLLGSTILVTLKSNDSLTMKNEMFIGGGYVPTPAHYNYRFEIPNYGNQQIVMTSVTDSVYYIMYRCVSPNPLVQNVTLKAVKLPFAILNVHTNTGGNIGNVTIKISGSLFRDSMTATLSKPGTTITASAVYFTNSTQVFATFNLQGKPLGIYDVTLMKPDSSTAVLPNGFSVVPANNGGLITGGGFNTGPGNGNAPGCDPGAASGLNSQLVVDLVIPSTVLLKRPIVILINYSNPTNFDIPAQSRVLYSEAGLKMAFTKEGVSTGTTSLYLELTEPGGPPGIIRAGASGTIIVHSRAADHVPDPNPVTWKLK